MMLSQPSYGESTIFERIQVQRALAAQLAAQSAHLKESVAQLYELTSREREHGQVLLSVVRETRRRSAETRYITTPMRERLGTSFQRTDKRVPNLHRLSFPELIERCKTGDSAAWDVLIRKSKSLVQNYARSLCGNRVDTEDVTSEVFVRLYRSLHTFRCGATYKAWLYRIVRNTYIDLFVRDSDSGHLSLDAPLCEDDQHSRRDIADTSPSPERIVLEKDTYQRLASAIGHLPSYQREVLQLYTQGVPYDDIAVKTGVSMGTVKSRLNRARNTLRERLDI